MLRAVVLPLIFLLFATACNLIEQNPDSETTNFEASLFESDYNLQIFQTGYATALVAGASTDNDLGMGVSKDWIHNAYEPTYTVGSLNQLLSALEKARSGDNIFVPGSVELDLTQHLIWNGPLQVPGGVTLYSDRGLEGSEGALLKSRYLDKQPMIQIMGESAGIMGFRIYGPDPTERRDHYLETLGDSDAYYQIQAAVGIEVNHSQFKLENSELAGWSGWAVGLYGGSDHVVRSNHFHRNTRIGLGYGVFVMGVNVHIERNVFERNRHAIAGTGENGCAYTAIHNIVVDHNESHAFDMHGGADYGETTNIAGEYVIISFNYFESSDVSAVAIRGVSRSQSRVTNNWFAQDEAGLDVVRAQGNVEILNNVYGASAEAKDESIYSENYVKLPREPGYDVPTPYEKRVAEENSASD